MVGLGGLLIAMAIAVHNLRASEWDPTLFVAFGEDATATLEYGRELLGDVEVRRAQGHDGKFFFVQANDPLYLDPSTHAVNLDRPTYRAQRMLYPLLAGGLGLLDPGGVAWGMLVVNVLALGAGTWGTAVFARDEGWSPVWGLAFGLNIGMLSEMTIGGAGIVAFALAMWALVAVQRENHSWAAVAFAGAALAREAMVLMVFGAAAWWWIRHRRVVWRWITAPLFCVLVWAVYLRVRLADIPSDGPSIQEIGLPFVGFFDALGLWVGRPMSLATGLAVFAMLPLLTLRAIRSMRLLAWSAVGFVPLAIVFTRQVWFSYFDITRAVAPVLTAWVMVTFARRDRGTVLA